MSKENNLEKPKTPENAEIKKKLKEKLMLEPRIVGVIIFITALTLTLTGIWQLILVAGFLGGLFTKKAKEGVKIGFLGVFCAWLLLFILYSVSLGVVKFFDYWLLDVMGLPINISFLFMILASFFGGCFGGLGCLNGVYVNRLIIERFSHSEKFARKYQ